MVFKRFRAACVLRVVCLALTVLGALLLVPGQLPAAVLLGAAGHLHRKIVYAFDFGHGLALLHPVDRIHAHLLLAVEDRRAEDRHVDKRPVFALSS